MVFGGFFCFSCFLVGFHVFHGFGLVFMFFMAFGWFFMVFTFLTNLLSTRTQQDGQPAWFFMVGSLWFSLS